VSRRCHNHSAYKIETYPDLTYIHVYIHTYSGIPEEKWVETCILVDKLEKVRDPTLIYVAPP